MFAKIKRRIFRRDRGALADVIGSRALMIGTQLQRPNPKKRWKRAHVLRSFGTGGRGVEIGVNRGDFSEILLEECRPERAWFIDPWEDREDLFESTSKRLSRYPNAEIIRERSDVAVHRFDDGSLDWLYIDGDHSYEVALGDLRDWTPKVRSGGVIAADDFYLSRPGIGDHPVKRAFEAFLAEQPPIQRWFMVAGQLVMTKA